MRKTWRRQLALGLAVVTIWTSGNAEHFYAGQKDCETPAISTERLTDTEQKINLDKVNYQVEKSAYAPVFDASYYAKCKFRFIGSPIPLATDQCFRS